MQRFPFTKRKRQGDSNSNWDHRRFAPWVAKLKVFEGVFRACMSVHSHLNVMATWQMFEFDDASRTDSTEIVLLVTNTNCYSIMAFLAHTKI